MFTENVNWVVMVKLRLSPSTAHVSPAVGLIVSSLARLSPGKYRFALFRFSAGIVANGHVNTGIRSCLPVHDVLVAPDTGRRVLLELVDAGLACRRPLQLLPARGRELRRIVTCRDPPPAGVDTNSPMAACRGTLGALGTLAPTQPTDPAANTASEPTRAPACFMCLLMIHNASRHGRIVDP